MGPEMPKLLKLSYCKMCQKMCKAANDQNSTFRGLPTKFLSGSVPKCSVSARGSVQACLGPGALSSLPQPSPADSSQARAQEPCPASQRFRESTYRSGSSKELPRKVQGPGVLPSAQGCAQVKNMAQVSSSP